VLDGYCRISISRFLRDRRIFEGLGSEVLPALARTVMNRGETALRAWSAGCASGEEPYSARIVWERLARPGHPDLRCEVTATDSDEHLLERARRAAYPPSSLRELPVDWRETFFEKGEGLYRLRPEVARDVRFVRQDLRREMPDGPFDAVLCRNFAFTYFDDALQREVLNGLVGRMVPGGALVIGPHEALPEDPAVALAPWPGVPCVWRNADLRTGTV
jgi:chemotaxis protein methyltransferase CheR